MKKLLFIMFLVSWSIQSQVYDSSCLTRAMSSQKMTNNITPGELHSPTGGFDTDAEFCINVKAHRITRTDGSGSPITDAFIEDLMNELGVFFGDINFVWDEVINTANSTTLFNSDVVGGGSPSSCPSYNFGLTDPFDSNTALDIFFHPDDLGPGNSSINVSDGIANGTRIVLSRHTNIKILSHEVGHVLGLFHTYHGTFGNGTASICENDDGFGNPSHNVECVGQANALNSGDYVFDTLADSGLNNDILADIDDCIITAADTFDHCGSGLLYANPDPTNIMKPTNSPISIDCFNHFTNGQKNRMKFFISSQSHLQSLLGNCPVDPHPCDSCVGAETASDNIVTSYEQTSCNTVSLEQSGLTNTCNEVRIFWDINSTDYVVLAPDSLEDHMYNTDGQYTIKIEIWRNGNECEAAERLIDVNVNCGTGCESNLLPINLGAANTPKVTPDVVVDSEGNFYMLFQNLVNQSQQFTDIENHDFTNAVYLLKFNQEQCLVNYIELSNANQLNINIEIDHQDNLYVNYGRFFPNILDGEFIKLDSNLTIIYQHQMSSTYQGNINVEGLTGNTPFNTRMAYAYPDSGAKINDNFIINPQPSQPRGPVVALLNTSTGLVYDSYLFNINLANISNMRVSSGATEVTNDKLYVSVSFSSSAFAGTINFGGQNYSYGSGSRYFIAKFNIVNNQLVPDKLIFTPQHFTHLEFNSIVSRLYIGRGNAIRAYSEDLVPAFFFATLDNDILSDLVYDFTSGKLLAATVSNPGHPTHLRLFNPSLGSPIWEASEDMSSIFFPQVAQKDDNIYLTGIYQSTAGLQNGLPPSSPFGYNIYIEHIDANNPPTFTETNTGVIKTAAQDNLISAYPNPFSNQFTLKDAAGIGIIKIEVFDSYGVRIKSQKYNPGEQITINKRLPGLYFAKVYLKDGTVKIINLIKK